MGALDFMLLSMLDQDAPQMAAMLDSLGVERSEVASRSPGMTFAAIKNCTRCPDKAICKTWQTGAEDRRVPPEFCPNAVLFRAWQDAISCW
jgi:hypothetical protein